MRIHKHFNECRGQETIRNTDYFHTLMAVYFIKQNISESISLTAKDPSLWKIQAFVLARSVEMIATGSYPSSFL